MGNLYNPDVRYSFNVPVEEKNNLFAWDPHGPWQDCTKMCQGTLVLKETEVCACAYHWGYFSVWLPLSGSIFPLSTHMYTTHTLHSFPVPFPCLLFSPLVFSFSYLTTSFVSTHFNIPHYCLFPVFSHCLTVTESVSNLDTVSQ